VRTIQRIGVLALMFAATVFVGGCAVKFGQDGLCLKPLFKVNVKLNRFDREGDRSEAHDCDCIGGDVIDGGIIDGGMIHGGFTHSGPLTVETEPLHGYPQLPGDGTLVAEGSLSNQGVANPAPVFAANAGQTSSSPSSSTGSQQAAKKRPGSLFLSTGLPMGTDGRPHSGVVRVGDRIVFGTYIKNQGDLPLDAFQLQGTFTGNLKPISVIRSSGPSESQLRSATTSARIEGQKIVFDRFDQLAPDSHHEYQVTAEVTSAGAGNFEVTQIEGPAVKKNTPITAQ
jgi:hypothetical protein